MLDKENSNPLARFAAAADERDFDTAKLVEGDLHKQRQQQLAQAADRNHVCALNFAREEKDGMYAEQLQEAEKKVRVLLCSLFCSSFQRRGRAACARFRHGQNYRRWLTR
jgi:hypothetical protein